MRTGWLVVSLGFVLLSPAAFAQSNSNTAAIDYKVVPDWLKLPEGRTEIGSLHGDVAVSSAGEVYISVQGKAGQDAAPNGPAPGIQVYAPDGKFLRNVPNAPNDLCGFIIRKEAQGEFIYGARLASGHPAADLPEVSTADQTRAGLDKQIILKMTLDGKIVLSIPPSAIPAEFKNKTPDGRPYLRLTGVAVAPNGDIYAVDGYSTSYVYQFDRTGKYTKSFGGEAAPYGFSGLHKIAIDTRFTPPRIIGCDRSNGRVVHMSLDGDFLGVVAHDVSTPSAVAIRGEYAVIAETGLPKYEKLPRVAQISILDKEGKVVAAFGTNQNADEIGSATTAPAKWRSGVLLAPHGVAFNEQGDIFVSEFNQRGRVQRFNLQQQTAAVQR